MAKKHNLDIDFKDIKNLYQVVPNSSLEYLWTGEDLPHYTIKGFKPKTGGLDLIYKAASMAGGVQHIKTTTNDVSISWLCRNVEHGNTDIQQSVNRFIWLLYWLEKNDKQFKKYKGTISEDALSQFRGTLRPLHDYNEVPYEGKNYMESINKYTNENRKHNNYGRQYHMTEYLRLKAMDKYWIYSSQEIVKDGEYHTQLIQDYLSLAIVEKDNKARVVLWDLSRGVDYSTEWLEDINLLSDIIDYLYTCWEEGWGTQNQELPNSEGNLGSNLTKGEAMAY